MLLDHFITIPTDGLGSHSSRASQRIKVSFIVQRKFGKGGDSTKVK